MTRRSADPRRNVRPAPPVRDGPDSAPRPCRAPRRRKDPRGPLGRRGETIAAWLLRLSGARILARNLRTPFGEIDIVARDRRRGTLLIVEVKTRRDLRPLEVPRAQVRRIARAALHLHAHPAERAGVRIDLFDIRLPRRWWPVPSPFPRVRRVRAAWGERDAELR